MFLKVYINFLIKVRELEKLMQMEDEVSFEHYIQMVHRYLLFIQQFSSIFLSRQKDTGTENKDNIKDAFHVRKLFKKQIYCCFLSRSVLLLRVG